MEDPTQLDRIEGMLLDIVKILSADIPQDIASPFGGSGTAVPGAHDRTGDDPPIE